MGEVYRARDTKLGREVAIKVLPDAFAQDKERLARFEREARFLASLNHPNIATIHGLEESEAVRYLVMELVEGETLAERIAKGAIPIDEALPIFQQIAEGLEAAHEKGVIHRDLKPANVKITPEGKVKVLDFGLAKAFQQEAEAEVDSSLSPTLTRLRQGYGGQAKQGTNLGAIMGTASYMSPEQAKGKVVDKRADIWAFGVCLYEAFSGKRPFDGDNAADILGSVLKLEPNWDALPSGLSADIDRLLRRCLEKDVHRRLRDIGDVRFEIEEAMTGPTPDTGLVAHATLKSFWKRPLSLALAFLFGGVVVGFTGWILTRPGPPTLHPTMRFQVPFVPDQAAARTTTRTVALSPDGSRLVYRAGTQLYLRKMDEGETIAIRGAETASSTNAAFFASDGRAIAFFQRGNLVRVPVEGGVPVKLCSVSEPRGATWGDDGTILFSQAKGIFELSRDGGTPKLVVPIDGTEQAYRPQRLPGDEAILFTVRSVASDSWDDAKIVAQVSGGGARHVLVNGGTDARYLRTGHLVYARSGMLLAVPFDVSRLEVIGEPRTIVEGVASSAVSGTTQFDVSRSGTLVTVPATSTSLVWVGRDGQAESIEGSRTDNVYHTPRLSPDGRQVAADATATGNGNGIWVQDLQHGTRGLLTRMAAATNPVWSPDGSELAFGASGETGTPDIFRKAADGTGEAELLVAGERDLRPISWSQDGQFLTMTEMYNAVTGHDIWVLPLQGEPRPFVVTDAFENAAQFSPDGRWIAYQSNESGRFEIYVQPFPGPGRRVLLSTSGGKAPVWRRDGLELFYRQGAALMAVSVRTTPTFVAGAPSLLFDHPYIADNTGHPAYDVSPDGEHFLMIAGGVASHINVVLNWTEELKRLVPTP
jgi:Tol biopolymer transport system component